MTLCRSAARSAAPYAETQKRELLTFAAHSTVLRVHTPNRHRPAETRIPCASAQKFGMAKLLLLVSLLTKPKGTKPQPLDLDKSEAEVGLGQSKVRIAAPNVVPWRRCGETRESRDLDSGDSRYFNARAAAESR